MLLWIIVFPTYLIKRAVYAARNEFHETMVVQPITPNVDELLKFKQLLDSGLISQIEFDAAKARILGTQPQRMSRPPFVQMK